MKWEITKTKNGAIFNITAEKGDSRDKINALRNVRAALATESQTTEGAVDTISFFKPIKWPAKENG